MPPKALPFKSIAGVTPCPGGWLVLPARVAGVTVVAEEAFVLPNLMQVLDYRPKFEFAGVYAPMGLHDEPAGPYRECDEMAKELGPFPGYKKNREHMLRVMRNHRRAAYGERTGYEKGLFAGRFSRMASIQSISCQLFSPAGFRRG